MFISHNLSLFVLNQAVTKSKLEFDLTRFRDFTLNFPGYQTQDDYSYQLLNPGMFTVTMAPEETIEGELIFMPTEVTEYCDFTQEGNFPFFKSILQTKYASLFKTLFIKVKKIILSNFFVEDLQKFYLGKNQFQMQDSCKKSYWFYWI